MAASTLPHIAHLSKDRKLKPILAVVEPYELKKRNNIGLHLCASILSQQLSTKVAAVIYERFLGLFEGNEPTMQQILDTPATTLRSIGLSEAKSRYVHNVATYLIAHKITDRKFHAMGNDEIIESLTTIKGVGRWTVEMLLMFTLCREDVFAVDDLGIQQAMTAIYGLDASDKKALKAEMLRISEKWAPYRTWACFYLWRHKDAARETKKDKK